MIKIPKAFTKEGKEITEEEIEEIIKKTLVDKILVENIAQELTKHLEGEILAKRLNIGFNKIISLKENNLDTVTRKEVYPYKEDPECIKNKIELRYETKSLLLNQEATHVLERIIELEPGLKEEEIIQKDNNCFSILSKKMIYELSLSYYTTEERVETGRTEPYKKTNKKTLGRFFKKNFIEEEIIELPLVDAYYNPTIVGVIKYVKFDHEHNAKILKALKDLGYNISVNIIEDKK